MKTIDFLYLNQHTGTENGRVTFAVPNDDQPRIVASANDADAFAKDTFWWTGSADAFRLFIDGMRTAESEPLFMFIEKRAQDAAAYTRIIVDFGRNGRKSYCSELFRKYESGVGRTFAGSWPVGCEDGASY
jgi:hypothetical protein